MSPHVLILDDDESLRELYSIFLQRENYHCTSVASIDEAKQVVQHDAIDVIFVDVNLNEDMTGLEFVANIRQYSQHDHIKVIVITSFPIKLSESPDLNLSAILQKPVTIVTLLSTLRNVLDVEQDQ